MLIFGKIYIPAVEKCIDHVVACGIYGMRFIYHIQNFNKNHIILSTPSNQIVSIYKFYLQPSIVVFKPHPLRITLVTYYY